MPFTAEPSRPAFAKDADVNRRALIDIEATQRRDPDAFDRGDRPAGSFVERWAAAFAPLARRRARS